MNKAFCIKSKPHPRIGFYEGELYDYYLTDNIEGENIYMVYAKYKDYISRFYEKEFNLHFIDRRELRDEKIKDILK